MINYLCTSPKPKLQGTDALYNEIGLLQNNFGGEVHSLFPFKKPLSRFPAFLYGLHNLRIVETSAINSKLNHIFAPSLVYLPVLNNLPNPIVFSIVTSISKQSKLLPKAFIDKLDALVVYSERDAKILYSNNFKNINVIKTGIDISPFTKHQLPVNGTFNLLMASAPWETKQLSSKGILLLLSTLQKTNNLHITFLWRNVLEKEIGTLIKKYDVADKVTLINKKTNVAQLLKTVHATVLLSNDASVVKAYPHSLIESIISGKPVITSKQIAMADFVEQNSCGLVLTDFNAAALLKCINNLQANYEQYCNATLSLNENLFSNKRMLKDYEMLYESLL